MFGININITSIEKEIDDWANLYSIENFQGKNRDDQNKNAFAHAYATAIINFDNGPLISNAAGSYRELKTAPGYVVNSILGKPGYSVYGLLMDTNRDLYNNRVGNEIAEYVKENGLPREAIGHLVANSVKTGQLIANEFQDPRNRAMVGPGPVYAGPSVAGLGVLQNQFGWKPTPDPLAANHAIATRPEFSLNSELTAEPYISMSPTPNLDPDLYQAAQRDHSTYMPTAIDAPINVLDVDEQGRFLSLPNIVKTIPLGPGPEPVTWAPAEHPPSALPIVAPAQINTTTQPMQGWVPAGTTRNAVPEHATLDLTNPQVAGVDPFAGTMSTGTSTFNGTAPPSPIGAAIATAPADNAIGPFAVAYDQPLGMEAPGILAATVDAVGALNHARPDMADIPGSVPSTRLASYVGSPMPADTFEDVANRSILNPDSLSIPSSAPLAGSPAVQALTTPTVQPGQQSPPTAGILSSNPTMGPLAVHATPPSTFETFGPIVDSSIFSADIPSVVRSSVATQPAVQQHRTPAVTPPNATDQVQTAGNTLLGGLLGLGSILGSAMRSQAQDKGILGSVAENIQSGGLFSSFSGMQAPGQWMGGNFAQNDAFSTNSGAAMDPNTGWQSFTDPNTGVTTITGGMKAFPEDAQPMVSNAGIGGGVGPGKG